MLKTSSKAILVNEP